MPPHLMEPIHPPHPEHEKRRVWKAISISTLTVGFFAVLLFLLQFPLTVVLPTSAPIWAGLSTILS